MARVRTLTNIMYSPEGWSVEVAARRVVEVPQAVASSWIARSLAESVAASEPLTSNDWDGKTDAQAGKSNVEAGLGWPLGQP